MIFTNAALKALVLGAVAISQAHANKHDKQGESAAEAAPLGNLRAARAILAFDDPHAAAAASKHGTAHVYDEKQALSKPPPPGGRLTNATYEKKSYNASRTPWCENEDESVVCFFRQSMNEDGTTDGQSSKFIQRCLPDDLTEGFAKGDVIPGDDRSHQDTFFSNGCCLSKASSLGGKDGEALGLRADNDVDTAKNHDSEPLALMIYETNEDNLGPKEEGLDAYLVIETPEELHGVCSNMMLVHSQGNQGTTVARELKSETKLGKDGKVDVCRRNEKGDGTYVKTTIQASKLEKEQEKGVLKPGDILEKGTDKYFLNDDCEATLITPEPSAAPSKLPSAAPSLAPSSIPSSGPSSSPSTSPSQPKCMSLTSQDAIDGTFCKENSCCRDGGETPCLWQGTATICEGACNGAGACFYLGNNAFIGSNSCNGDSACGNLGNNAVIGSNSCNGPFSCLELGFSTTGTIAIGDDACNGERSCDLLGVSTTGTIAIGDDACIGDSACIYLGENVQTGDIAIGEDACIGDSACDWCTNVNSVAPETQSIPC